MRTVLVMGGTGTLGREVVRALAAAGHRPRIASRRPRPASATHRADGTPRTDGADGADRTDGTDGTDGVEWATVDYTTGAGLADAVAGADAVVLATGAPRDAGITRAVIRATDPATHLVYISIVGVDRVPMFYYRHKLDAERVLTSSERPWTVLRATQFHDLALTMVRALARPPLVLVPRGAQLQPVSAAEVGARLAQLAVAPAAGWAPELGGPEVLGVDDLARTYLRATGRRRRIASVPIPGRIMGAVARGALTSPQHATGRRTFEQFLAERLPG